MLIQRINRLIRSSHHLACSHILLSLNYEVFDTITENILQIGWLQAIKISLQL